MKKVKLFSIILCMVICLGCGCNNMKVSLNFTSEQANKLNQDNVKKTITVNKDKNIIKERYDVPDGYERIRVKKIVLGNF